MVLNLYFSLIFLQLLLNSLIHCEVIFVFEHFRHGARGPGFTVSETVAEYTDQYGIVWEGNGEGTGIGMRMEYLLGVQNRLRYNHLLSTIFDPKELLVFSTEMSRTIMSAQAQLQGMFPPQTGIKLAPKELEKAIPPYPLSEQVKLEIKKLGNDALADKVQIIPIHILNKQELNTILSDINQCSPLRSIKNELRKQQMLTDFYIKLNSTYGKELFSYFNVTESPDYLFDYWRVFFLADVFISDYDNNHDGSSLEKVGINLTQYYDLSVEMKNLHLFHTESNENMSKMALSPTMRKILAWMEKRIYRDINKYTYTKYEEPKYVMYSGHDTTGAPFQLFMKAAFKTPISYPHFASSVYGELHRHENVNTPSEKDYFVRYIKDGEMMGEVSFTEFKERVHKGIWTEERVLQYCQAPLEGRIIGVGLAGLIVLGFIGVLTVAVLCFQNKRKMKKKKRKYSFASLDNDIETV